MRQHRSKSSRIGEFYELVMALLQLSCILHCHMDKLVSNRPYFFLKSANVILFSGWQYTITSRQSIHFYLDCFKNSCACLRKVEKVI